MIVTVSLEDIIVVVLLIIAFLLLIFGSAIEALFNWISEKRLNRKKKRMYKEYEKKFGKDG